MSINDSGQVVGYSYPNGSSRATLWQQGQVIDLGHLGGTATGYTDSEAIEINNRGQVLVQSVRVVNGVVLGRRTAVWEQGGLRHIKPPWPDTGFSPVLPVDMNESGQVVATGGLSGEWPKALVSLDGRSFIDLNTVVAASNLKGWQLFEALKINNAGQILALARWAPTNERATFLLTPLPKR
ncbi:hypothetical protein [Eleftheria terrae]|uniref:hypothetical protein n=1 Tax=Eleftheria terrae TaxID=1597781 RepID=UPI00263A66F9|nr:hypothetical protein [Eleftheria terrae]WKB51800.1 hypothetical protein N7L95_18630 [Eleftheria terrae]